ncbi:unnamed protein product [Spirodela intermedia]|uniref:AB hydrolase-1 domain-containing protein n=1 Tax=Spirodela intermedia TaxID=51605 RepID=A0A7I8JFT8_SPIIN|nr:unnamed protein product [Spirodela intermedia]CAA6668272.1 unnamed protein product [Spirodela intermedia]
MAAMAMPPSSVLSPPSARLLLPASPSSSSFSIPSRRRGRRSGMAVVGDGRLASGALAESSGWQLKLPEIYEACTTWQWRGFNVNFLVKGKVAGDRLPVLLVHGFGASIPHWRRNIEVLAENYTVYAIDLLGFGASDKPEGFEYTMETWAELILDFLDEVVRRPTVLIGNSVGSLACVIAASESTGGLVQGLVLLNCAGGMNNKAVVDDWRIKLLFPLLSLFDILLRQRWIASALFDRVKQRAKSGVPDTKISLPVLVLWGDQDPFTPLDGPVGRYFSSLPARLPNISLYVLEGVGHCPHDDRPDAVHEKLLPWLSSLSKS